MDLNSSEKLPLPNPPQPPFWYSSPLSSFSMHPILWIISRNNVGLNIIVDAVRFGITGSRAKKQLEFIIRVLENIASLLLPFVYCASRSPDAARWVKLDQLLDAMLTNKVGRTASTLQGSALSRVAASVFTEIQSLQDLRRTFLGSTSVLFHHAPIFGLICGLVGFDSETTQRAYMFVAMRDVISAATRLNLIGPLAASVLQHQVAPDAEKMLQKWRDRDVSEASQTAPLLDALQGCHAYMFSRLFCS
ncbi:urease accessory protein F [Triticum aestivum]|uniref:urease accessory protein F n=1 Tax=Triticum aestivum TaxID=4565 RepID=UPI001D01387C|nr:urease accessory protein F-like [Triticum aestivum]